MMPFASKVSLLRVAAFSGIGLRAPLQVGKPAPHSARSTGGTSAFDGASPASGLLAAGLAAGGTMTGAAAGEDVAATGVAAGVACATAGAAIRDCSRIGQKMPPPTA
jgi:hypothetical protein